MVRDRDADESSSASQSKRPSLHHQESDSTNSDQAGREHHHQQRTKPQKHLVGAGRLHARVPSSKALHKHHGSTASKLNHRRIASPSPERKPTSITGHRRVQSEAKLSRDNSSTNLSKNASSASLRRNKSHGEVNKKSKSADKLKRTNSNPAVNKVKPQKSQVHFDLGNDGQEDEWVDASASASPYLSRRGSLASAQSSAKHDDSSANNSRTETPTVQPSPPAAATPDRETLQHKAYLTSRLLQRTPSHGAPPKMTADTVSVSRRGHSRSPDSISRVSTLAESHNVSAPAQLAKAPSTNFQCGPTAGDQTMPPNKDHSLRKALADLRNGTLHSQKTRTVPPWRRDQPGGPHRQPKSRERSRSSTCSEQAPLLSQDKRLEEASELWAQARS
ncbi:hypothetical protein Cob_v001971 [Colletotrichum orbiculare MAFF 240422]|uniref:Uncharacterized protein n=1 Tax=Colletotrichum orbiculare (strain 104-T / ATCC 96160 / CBS 514.97 / LARS 414 / MAFF 240422) TaxID=1213857 RepID=N4VDE5_COLOR|nr:hypothetical protein Cob_v001971 [Colletotrichum orbiculare MAFF 240422]